MIRRQFIWLQDFALMKDISVSREQVEGIRLLESKLQLSYNLILYSVDFPSGEARDTSPAISAS